MAVADKIRESLNRSSWIRKMFEEGDRLRTLHGADRVYDFTLGNPDLEPPDCVTRRLQRLVHDPALGMHKYMSNAGYRETRQAVAAHVGAKAGLRLTENHVVMTVGAGGALNVVLKTILNPGDEVVASAPYFVEYGFYTDNHQGKLVVVKTQPDFQLDIVAIAAAITSRTRAVLINSPNNPTGVVYPSEALRALAKALEQKEAEFGTTIYLISDEPYAGLVFDGVVVPPVLTIFGHGILVTSHSKDLALPGERIGYIAINPAIPEADTLFDGLVFANRVLGFVNAPALMQRLVANLQGESVGVEVYQERRDLLYAHLSALGFDVVRPQGAFYMFPKSPISDDVAFVRAAAKHNLLLVPGSGFGSPGHFRIAYCVPKETIIKSFPAFEKVAKDFGLSCSPG
jgi:aspartate aminotransferase